MIRTKEERLQTLERIVREALDQTDADGNPRPNLIAAVQAIRLAHQIASERDEENFDVSPEFVELVDQFVNYP